ncbi:MAG: hypothetical protein DDT34_01588 [Firmicutes bacterium]|nr:hypothetical protein [Bacillota bacterium]MBT9153182.1 hypothetical protein [Bacillota bacterium]
MKEASKWSYPVVDYILTGLLISRGSNVLHDLLQQVGKYKKIKG